MSRRHSRGRPRAPEPVADLVFGINPVRELLRAQPDALQSLVAVPGTRAVEPLLETARQLGVAVELTDVPTLDRLTGRGHHQGVAARARAFRYAALSELLQSGSRLLVALDGVTDPQNLGAIIRSAEVLGAGGLILPQDRTAAVSPAAARASAGASAHLPVARVVNLARALAESKEVGYWIVGLDPEGAQQFQQLPDIERAIIVIGSEGAGTRRLIRAQCDFRVQIPVHGRVESLNASVAAGIGIYELGRLLGVSKA